MVITFPCLFADSDSIHFAVFFCTSVRTLVSHSVQYFSKDSRKCHSSGCHNLVFLWSNCQHVWIEVFFRYSILSHIFSFYLVILIFTFLNIVIHILVCVETIWILSGMWCLRSSCYPSMLRKQFSSANLAGW